MSGLCECEAWGDQEKPGSKLDMTPGEAAWAHPRRVLGRRGAPWYGSTPHCALQRAAANRGGSGGLITSLGVGVGWVRLQFPDVPLSRM
jgi:hypothetical protein